MEVDYYSDEYSMKTYAEKNFEVYLINILIIYISEKLFNVNKKNINNNLKKFLIGSI